MDIERCQKANEAKLHADAFLLNLKQSNARHAGDWNALGYELNSSVHQEAPDLVCAWKSGIFACVRTRSRRLSTFLNLAYSFVCGQM